MHPSERNDDPIRSQLVLPEWIEAGLLGGFAVVAVFLVRDLWLGEPFHTPSVLGVWLFEGIESARRTTVELGAACAYHAVHFAAWVVVGLVATRLVRRAEDQPALWYLPLLGAAAGVLALLLADGALRETGLGRPHLWLGGIAGIAVTGAFLLWRHPRVLRGPAS